MRTRVCFALLSTLLVMNNVQGSVIQVSTTLDSGEQVSLSVGPNTGQRFDLGNGLYQWTGSQNNGVFDVSWDFTFDPDPGVSGSLSVTNLTAGTLPFFALTGVISSVSLPAGSPMIGSSTITIADSDFSDTSATMSSGGGSIYAGEINGITQRRLFPGPAPGAYSLVAPGDSTNLAQASFGPEPSSTAISPGSLLSLRHAFTLSGGDTATANSLFFVTAVPEPGQYLMFALVGVCFGVHAVGRRFWKRPVASA